MTPKTFRKGINLEPQSTDPVSPVEGDLQYADGTVRAKGLWQYKDSTWQSVGSGGGGLDVFVRQDFSSDTVSTFSSGNNASFLGGGSVVGTPANEEVSPISGDRSIKFTQASGSLNDYIASGSIALDPKQRSNDIGISFYYTYDGADDDLSFVVYDVTNGAVISSALDLIKAKGTATRFSTSFYVPATCTEIKYGFQVKVESIGSVLVFDDVEMSTNPFVYKNLTDTQLIQGDTAARTTTPIEWVNVSSTGSNILEHSVVGSVSRFTATRDCNISLNATLFQSANSYINHYVNGSLKLEDAGTVGVLSGSAAIQGTSFSYRLSAGDYISMTTTASLSGTTHCYFTLVATAETEHVVTPATANSEYYATTVINTANFWDATGSIYTFDTTLVPLTNSKLLEWSDTTQTRLVAKQDVIVTTGAYSEPNIGGAVILYDSSSNAISYTQQSGSVYSTMSSVSVKLRKGEYIYYRSSNAANTNGGIYIHAQPVEATFLAAIPKVQWQKNVMTSNSTPTQMNFSNLTVGKTYRLHLSAHIRADNAGNDYQARVEALHNGAVLLTVGIERPNLYGGSIRINAGNEKIFKATASTITFQEQYVQYTVANDTYAILEELNFHDEETTRFS